MSVLISIISVCCAAVSVAVMMRQVFGVDLSLLFCECSSKTKGHGEEENGPEWIYTVKAAALSVRNDTETREHTHSDFSHAAAAQGAASLRPAGRNCSGDADSTGYARSEEEAAENVRLGRAIQRQYRERWESEHPLHARWDRLKALVSSRVCIRKDGAK